MANISKTLLSKLHSGSSKETRPTFPTEGHVPEQASADSADASLKGEKDDILIQEAELDSPGQLSLEEG